jgi:subtilase family serine protease
MKNKFIVLFFLVFFLFSVHNTFASYHFSNYHGRNPIHIYKTNTGAPKGISPDIIKAIYSLPKTGGHGTIAIVGAYDDITIEKDLGVFDQAFNLPACTTKNGCLEKHLIDSDTKTNSGWGMETSLDIEWAHAIAPQAKILLVSAKTPSGANLLKAVDYAAGRADVTAISMSFGGAEFPEEKSLDAHFKSNSGAVFFASSGDNGWGASWPASSPNVVSVGGTSLSLKANGMLTSESAWSGSGGGVSAYESAPNYQTDYSIPKSGGMRAIPDVSYNADPKSGFSIYVKGKWYVVGGTSAGAPQWAAIQSLGLSATNEKLYADKSSDSFANFFRDIVSGSNGNCKYYCQARKHYDYITGLGSPVTVNF